MHQKVEESSKKLASEIKQHELNEINDAVKKHYGRNKKEVRGRK